jgi:hypothetical protein
MISTVCIVPLEKFLKVRRPSTLSGCDMSNVIVLLTLFAIILSSAQVFNYTEKEQLNSSQ